LAEFFIGFLSGELPVQWSALPVATLLPHADVAAQLLASVVASAESPIQALAGKNTNFNFRHIQPTGVLGRVVEPDPP
jgi:hypothetical protein